MPRRDVSDKLIHFTKGETCEEAFQRIRTIIRDRHLIGGSGCIRGHYNCVCFSEAPLPALENGLLNSSAYSRYSPFGILFDKAWIFERGGRPVIYQPDSEYEALPDSHKWRHVRYEPGGEQPIDFTWEREWRILTDQLPFDPSDVAVVLPDNDWAERLKVEHESEQDLQALQYSQIMDETLAIQYRQTFGSLIYVLAPSKPPAT